MEYEKIFNNKALKERRKELRANMTHAEVLLWNELRSKKLEGYKFRRQHSIGNYVVDFYCPKLSLIVEVDGDTHYSDEEIEHDLKRQNFLQELGLTTVRFTNEEIYLDLITVLDKIKAKAKELERFSLSAGGRDES